MYYGNMKKLDTANSKGIGSTLFVSGCTHNCKGCFNKDSQKFTYGKPFTKEDEDRFIQYIQHPQVKVASILGGEPLQQPTHEMLQLVKRIKEETGKPIWMWTGYTLEELYTTDKMEILQYVDVLIDGRFELDKKDLMLKYRGSSNQRVIDMQKTLEQGEIVLFDYN